MRGLLSLQTANIANRRPVGIGLLNLPQRRRTFFSFHFADVLRVNAVRNAFKIYNPQTSLLATFQDSSLWERKKLEHEDNIKSLIRAGVSGTSVVAVLVGAETWARRWVRYEIARSIVDGKGLLAIHINDIRHHLTRQQSLYGINPLTQMGLCRNSDGTVRIIEQVRGTWQYYRDYGMPVELPKYVSALGVGFRIALSDVTIQRRFMMDNGHKNIGVWIDAAAKFAKR